MKHELFKDPYLVIVLFGKVYFEKSKIRPLFFIRLTKLLPFLEQKKTTDYCLLVASFLMTWEKAQNDKLMIK